MTDILRGGNGADTYYFGQGSGQDFIEESTPSTDQDRIRLSAGITAEDLIFEKSSNNLIIHLQDSSDSLTIVDQFGKENPRKVEILLLDNGEQIDLTDPILTWHGSDRADTYTPTEYFQNHENSNGYRLRLTGEGNDDNLRGSGRNDTIAGGSGNDWLYGQEGDDLVTGGMGDDTIGTDEGNDTLIGGEGFDRLHGGAGNDWLNGGESADELNGGEGNDTLIGGAGSDTLWGSYGQGDIGDSDEFRLDLALPGQDIIADFNPETDRIVIENAPGIRNGQELMAIARFEILTYSTRQGSHHVKIEIGNASFIIENSLRSDLHPDMFQIAPPLPASYTHPLTIHQGTRSAIPIDPDWFPYETIDTLSYRLSLNSHPLLPDWLSLDTQTGTIHLQETAIAGQHQIALIISDGLHDAKVELPITVVSQAGGNENDVLTATNTETAEYLSGGDGSDELSAGQHNDTLEGGEGNDTLTGGQGTNLQLGGNGDDYMMLGDNPEKWPEGFYAWNVYSHDTAQITGKNRISDMFNGGEGSDKLYLSHGDDAFFLHDFFTEHANGNPESARILGVEKIYGGIGDDVIDMTSDRFFVGGVTAYGEDGDDAVWGNEGNDRLYGGNGTDNVQGGTGNDTLYGDAGTDTLKGNEGADRLIGGEGTDHLWGGEGADIFVFRPEDFTHIAEAAVTDYLMDYTQGEDRIDLSEFTNLQYADLQFTFQDAHTLIEDMHHQFRLDLIGEHHLTEADFQWV